MHYECVLVSRVDSEIARKNERDEETKKKIIIKICAIVVLARAVAGVMLNSSRDHCRTTCSTIVPLDIHYYGCNRLRFLDLRPSRLLLINDRFLCLAMIT